MNWTPNRRGYILVVSDSASSRSRIGNRFNRILEVSTDNGEAVITFLTDENEEYIAVFAPSVRERIEIFSDSSGIGCATSATT